MSIAATVQAVFIRCAMMIENLPTPTRLAGHASGSTPRRGRECLAARQSENSPPTCGEGSGVGPLSLDHISRDLFGFFLFAKQLHRGMKPMQAALDAGVRLGQYRAAISGHVGSLEVFHKLCAWQGEDPEIFVKREARNG